MRIVSVLHPGGGHSGVLRASAANAGAELVEWTPAAGEDVPAGADALVVFGGGMNVHEAERLPWLRGEIELLRDALADGTPVLGVCLGAQLLAAAAGAEIARATAPEIGWCEVCREAAGAGDALLGALPERFTAFQWHSYAFRPPAGAAVLASSRVCPQAFRLDGRAWGVQFHPEVTDDILAEWFGDYEADPDAVALGFDPEAAAREARDHLAGWNAIGRALFDAFLTAARAARSPRPRPC
jgi:GMP synthase (glutamine-hydrolysing)